MSQSQMIRSRLSPLPHPHLFECAIRCLELVMEAEEWAEVCQYWWKYSPQLIDGLRDLGRSQKEEQQGKQEQE
jgi:hypothetical protein